MPRSTYSYLKNKEMCRSKPRQWIRCLHDLFTVCYIVADIPLYLQSFKGSHIRSILQLRLKEVVIMDNGQLQQVQTAAK